MRISTNSVVGNSVVGNSIDGSSIAGSSIAGWLPRLLISCMVLVLMVPSPVFAAPLNDVASALNHQDGISADVTATLEVISAAPSTDSITRIDVSGTWPTECVPEYASADGPPDSGYLWITAVAEPVDATCAQVETEWAFSIDHQFATPGYHSVELIIVNEALDSQRVSASKLIEVSSGLSILPKEPDPNEPFSVSIGGIHNDGCTPYEMTYEVVGTTIMIDVLLPEPGPCPQALTPWQLNMEIEGLAEGDYTIEVYKPNWVGDADWGRTLLFHTRELSVGVATAQSASSFSVFLPGFMRQ